MADEAAIIAAALGPLVKERGERKRKERGEKRDIRGERKGDRREERESRDRETREKGERGKRKERVCLSHPKTGRTRKQDIPAHPSSSLPLYFLFLPPLFPSTSSSSLLSSLLLPLPPLLTHLVLLSPSLPPLLSSNPPLKLERVLRGGRGIKGWREF